MTAEVLWGVVVLALSLLAWGGQALSWAAPALAQAWGLTENEAAVEATFHADIRGEAAWDTLTLWTMPVAAVLLIAGSPTWGYVGLIAGGMYLYFAGRGITTRMVMQRRGIRIGSPANVRAAYALLTVWAVMAVVTLGLAVAALEST